MGATGRRGRRSATGRLGALLVLSAVLLAAGWSLFWLFASWQARQGLDAWLASEQQAGRVWTCPQRRVGGFPLSIVLTCEQPTFADARDASFKGGLARLRAEAQLYFPTSVAIDLTGPLLIRDKAIDGDLSITWSMARLVLRGDLPGRLDRGNLDAEGVAIAAGPRKSATRIGHGAIAFRPLVSKTAGPGDAELKVEATDVHDADADAALGSNEPIVTELAATITKLPEQGVSLPILLEAWRAAGGTVRIERFHFAKGSFSAEGAGTLSIDESHRPQGQLDARFGGLEPVAARFGIPIAAVTVGGLLSNLLGGKKGAQAETSGLALPLAARGGHLYLGPVKTGVALPPLY